MTYKNVVTSPVTVAYQTQALLGECPRWDEVRQVLYWVDIDKNRLQCFDPATGDNKIVTFKEKIGCFSLRENGGFVVGMQSGYGVLDGFNHRISYMGDPEQGIATNRFNDGRCDPAGRFVAGTVNMTKSNDNAHIYQTTADTFHTPVTLVSGMYTANGIAFSNDGTTLYYSDTPNHIVYKGDYNPADGTLDNIVVFHDFTHSAGRPDGAAIDAEGYYWVAMYNGAEVLRISPAGHIVERVAVPAKNCTMVAFGGTDLRTVYITTAASNMTGADWQKYPHAGSIFRFRTSVAGTVEHRFKG